MGRELLLTVVAGLALSGLSLVSALLLAGRGSAQGPTALPIPDALLSTFQYQVSEPMSASRVTESQAADAAKAHFEYLFGGGKAVGLGTAARHVLLSDQNRHDMDVWVVTLKGEDLIPAPCGPGIPVGQEWKLQNRQCPKYNAVYFVVDASTAEVVEFVAEGSSPVAPPATAVVPTS